MDESESIDQYLRGEMSQSEHLLFEQRMLSDQELRRAVQLRGLIVQTIKDSAEERLKSKLKELDVSLEQRSKRTYLKIAASIVIMMALIFYFNSGLKSNKEVIAKYDLVDIGIPNKMGSSDKLQLTQGMNYFKQHEYAKALHSFSGIKQQALNDTVSYYSGICYYRLDSTNQALQLFYQVANSDSPYQLKAEYRLGLCYWTRGELEKAKGSFLKVSSSELPDYSIMAKRILDETF